MSICMTNILKRASPLKFNMESRDTLLETSYNKKLQGEFLATLVALHFTLVSESVGESVSRSFELA